MRLFSLFAIGILVAVAGAVVPTPAKSNPVPTSISVQNTVDKR